MKFIQIAMSESGETEISPGGITLVALGDDGIVYRYTPAKGTGLQPGCWLPLPSQTGRLAEDKS
jgi:hypothetical protein